MMGLVIGCAHKKFESQENTLIRPEYVEVTPTVVGEITSKNCPNQLQNIKNLSWQKAVSKINSCVAADQWDNVETLASSLAQTEHLAPWGSYFLSLSAEHRKEWQRALWMIELAVKKAPRNGLLNYQKARLLWVQNEKGEALKSFKLAVGLDPRLTEAQVFLGQHELALNNLAQAEKHFVAALNVDPKSLLALLGQSEILIRKGDGVQAHETLSKTIHYYPKNFTARLKQAQVLENLIKDLPSALTAYQKIQQLWQKKQLDGEKDLSIPNKIQELESKILLTTKEKQMEENKTREPSSKKLKNKK